MFDRLPIEIESNDEFEAANGVFLGSGTEEDPYIIERFRIDGQGREFGVILENTSQFVVIRNCEVFSAGIGIALSNTQNVTVENCHIHDNRRAIEMSQSNHLKINNNLIEFNAEVGIGLFRSENVTLQNNRIWNNWLQDGSISLAVGIFSDDVSISVGRENQVAGHQVEVLIVRTDEDGNSVSMFGHPLESPETNCSKIFIEFPTLFVTKTPEAPEPTEPYCGVLLSMVRSLPLNLLGRITQVIFEDASEEVAGLFTGVGVIRVLNVRDLRFFTEVFYHEAAHAIQNSFFDNRLNSNWIRLSADSRADQDHFALSAADSFRDESNSFFSYGMTNDHEDFATTFQAYTRNTFAMLRRAQRIEAHSGKIVLLEKMKFVASLIRLGSPDITYRNVVGWNTDTGEVSVKIQTTEVMFQNGLPLANQPLEWTTH